MSVVDLTRNLARVPSHEDATAAGDLLEEWLRRETDATVTRDEVGNVLARKGAGEETLALVGHHDVVAPADSQVGPDGEYLVEERDGRLYGRGTADMKGAVAAAAIAFRDSEVPDTAGSPARSAELVFASFVGEEVGGVGARHAIDEGFAPDYAVVGEGSTGYSASGVTDVAVAHKGRRGSTITARGKRAHASEQEAGENAIYRASDAVDIVRELEPPAVDVAGERLAGSVVVTEIEGGTAMNVVPDRCTVTVDERTVPGERAPLEDVTDIDGVEWTVDQDLPPMECGDEAFAETVLEAADGAQTGAPELVTKPHATDAGWLSQAGTDCVICGAAEPGEAHTDTESVSTDVLERCVAIYRRVAETWPR
ncbi:M20 family metallopeptidase [Natronococcus occultus]|uniref:Acetylornithine deacetylase/succinyldiaminopimelate desuccinylase-like deacylase n=1 Tax=Natronococcus occultus SP4 TaxID=694430 RepID=L0JYP9_9EURY|nr:M20/M25/M40 family metallo-hydrolase [Natronococcus occultus]AGB38177.1 acetylornithine deacetylase/succinyldiaminopimelate desuccinylase-like deacylase [Natronococcus occultus SP4]